MHDTLTTRTGTDFWFKSVLKPRMYETVTDLIDDITRKQGFPPTAGKVISEITFGFWPLIFSKSYNSLWWRTPEPPLAKVIPNHPNIARDTRKHFATRLAYLVALRNRVMHQEAIFQGVAALNRPVLPIDTLHTQLLETINWINSDAAIFASCLDHFDDTYHHGKARIDADLRQRFNL